MKRVLGCYGVRVIKCLCDYVVKWLRGPASQGCYRKRFYGVRVLGDYVVKDSGVDFLEFVGDSYYIRKHLRFEIDGK